MALTREFLKSLEIGDDITDKIVIEHGKTIQQEQAKYADYDTIKQAYEQQGKDLEKLKKLDPERMQEEIGKLTDAHKIELATQKQNATEMVKRMAVKSQFTNAHDPDLVLSQIDLSKIELDETGNIKAGFKEQFEDLTTNKAFLFKVAAEQPIFTGVKPAEGTTQETTVNDSFLDGFSSK